VCINVSCEAYGSREILSALGTALEDSDVEVKTIVCFGACELAPNIVLHPKGLWYSHVDTSDVPEIVESIKSGTPVARLQDKVDPKLYDLIMSLIDAGIE
jgi:(2Fe-2S) ferredoxin